MCGGEAIIYRDVSYYVVRCKECPTTFNGYKSKDGSLISMSKPETVAAWNTRVEPEPRRDND